MDTMSVNGKDFTVIELLGKGKGGYSYLVSDGEHNYVLKQIHHTSRVHTIPSVTKFKVSLTITNG